VHENSLLALERALRWARLRLVVQAIDPVVLKGFIGPTLRGMLGEALHDAAWRDATTGEIDPSSLYRTIFEGPRTEANVSRPPPYLVHPPGPNGLRLDPGVAFTYELTLIGGAAAGAPALCWHLFRLGLNKGIARHRARFLLKEVWARTPDRDVCLFHGSSGPVADRFEQEWTWDGEQLVTRTGAQLPRDVRAVTLALTTPLDLRVEGKPVSNLTFRLLFRSVIRNLATYARNYGDGPLELDFEAWKEQAGTMAKTKDQTEPHRVVHFSRRQLDREGRPRPFSGAEVLSRTEHREKARVLVQRLPPRRGAHPTRRVQKAVRSGPEDHGTSRSP